MIWYHYFQCKSLIRESSVFKFNKMNSENEIYIITNGYS